MDLHLSNKVAVVTGASKGIGLAITRVLAAEGVHVVAGARTVTGELTQLAGDGLVHPVTVDLSTPDGPGHLVEAAINTFGRLDILVNNVGAVRPRTGGFVSVTNDDWADTLNINFLAAVYTTRAALPHLLDAGNASIVTISSVNATLPDPLVIDYSAAKAALLNFCKALSKQVGAKGLRVNTISPGPVSTDLWLGPDGVAAAIAHDRQGDPAAIAHDAANESITRRFTRPDEIADLVAYLASDRAANITGANLAIDGGLITTI